MINIEQLWREYSQYEQVKEQYCSVVSNLFILFAIEYDTELQFIQRNNNFT